MAKFDLAAKLKEAASNLNTPGAEQIEYLPFELLDPDPDNFYSIDGLNELADSIATVGILTPLRVRANGGRYTITSGHRRRAAVQLLIDSGEDWSRGLPCIVDRGESTPEWEELKLIFANRQRVKTSAELSREAERTDELFCALREKGYDFPGRMQEHVAQALGVKASKLKRLHAIRSRAQKYVLDAYDTGKINESVAYELSQAPKDLQKMIIVQMRHANRPLSELTAEQVAKITDARNNMANRGCYFNKNVRCAYVNVRMDEALRRRFRGSKVGNCQKGGCCKGCSALAECEACCEKMEWEQQKAMADRERRRAEIEKTAEELRAKKQQADAEAAEICAEIWARIKKAAEASGVELENVLADLCETQSDIDQALRFIDGSEEDYGFAAELLASELEFLADRLECSTDFLLGRTEDPQINEGGDQKAGTWQTGTPKKKGWYVAKVSRLGEKTGAPMLLLWGDNGWSVAGGAATIHSSYTIEMWSRIPD
ncbi:MAG: ParB N-terminal domain-containing protein [Oscillospiraceae bacterium]|nr:ParB N-terminal domain-containing protein [Oscillospiraceae bacterium]